MVSVPLPVVIGEVTTPGPAASTFWGEGPSCCSTCSPHDRERYDDRE
ncbi:MULTISPECIES: hypothetical protein [unclassified Dietzia]|nr:MULTISPECIES: hypothetical protein [unclassified Dietzia]QGW26351.1 hypothetical protein GJR88_05087 [Dietzia sp. DQ12-45-1b]